jgi:hypothetical protein
VVKARNKKDLEMSRSEHVDRRGSALTVLAEICRTLEEAKSLSLDDVKRVRDQAVAVQRYVESARMGLKLQNVAAEMRLRTERRAGEILGTLRLRGGDRKSNGHADRLKLGQLGLSQNQSKRWQRIAAVPERVFLSYLSHAGTQRTQISASGLLRYALSPGLRRMPDSVRIHDVPSRRKQENKPKTNGQSIEVDPAHFANTHARDATKSGGHDSLEELGAHLRTLRGILDPILKREQVPRTIDLRGVDHYFAEMAKLIMELKCSAPTR